MDIQQTPWLFVEKIIDSFNAKNNLTLEFSVYKSGGQGITIYRKIKKIKANNFSLMYSLENDLKKEEELALNSRVYIDKIFRYIPMCDFSFSNYDTVELYLNDIQQYLQTDIYIYKSSRSHHMFAPKLLTLREWSKFCGYLLLMNRPEQPFNVVDSRWIGHSLEQGFGALRFTCNSLYYLQEPLLFKILYYNCSNCGANSDHKK
ncbi:hypothetical protein EZS27_023961 [termite gut metagenome]|uniref:Uncharacterized protein n=1 Tax=termite gut metagenome TaxID=433724 RepID=A0A5J4QZR3_9ZZZZ